MKKTTVLLVDAHKLITNGIAFLLNLQPELQVIGEASAAEQAIKIAADIKPNVALIEYKIAAGNDYDLTKKILLHSCATKIIWLSAHAIPSYVRKMTETKCSGYLTKNSPPDELLKAIREVNSGNRYICGGVKTKLTDEFIGQDEPFTRLDCLTLRELEMIYGIKKGLSSKEIAALQGISVKTVEAHRYNILKKLKLKNTAALVNLMYEKGL
jgi:two-component system invasion response regulator UvrY